MSHEIKTTASSYSQLETIDSFHNEPNNSDGHRHQQRHQHHQGQSQQHHLQSQVHLQHHTHQNKNQHEYPNGLDVSMSSVSSNMDNDDLTEVLPLFRPPAMPNAAAPRYEQEPMKSVTTPPPLPPSQPEHQQVLAQQQRQQQRQQQFVKMQRMPSVIDEDLPAIMPRMDGKPSMIHTDLSSTSLGRGIIRQDSFSTIASGMTHRDTVWKYQFARDHWFWKRVASHKWHRVKLVQLIMGCYILIMTFGVGLQDPETGHLIDPVSPERTARGVILLNGAERAVVATSTFQLVSLVCSRFSAFFMYPALVLVYISKFRATLAFLAHTPLAMFMESDMHKLHVYCGYVILVDSVIHTIFHTLRWAAQGNASLLITHISGVTGVILFTTLIAICLPMMMFKKRIAYEMRKHMHYAFILFGVALCLHSPKSAVPNGGFAPYVFGTLLVWWALDFAYCTFIMTEKIETTKFLTLSNGAQMTMNVSQEFRKRGPHGGYVYVCFPWIDKQQWHAFSLFGNPANPEQLQVYMQQAGDWTEKVLGTLQQRETVRPVWVQGPYPSPYDNCVSYDNQILVASGIGITPALSVIRAHRLSRRVNLIWAVRDKDLLQFFLRHMYLDNTRGWNLIFYTGKQALDDEAIMNCANTNVCIIQGRPNLGKIIPNIIYGVETQKGLPERYCPDEKRAATAVLLDLMVNDPEKIISPAEIEAMASERGYHLKSGQAQQLHQLFLDDSLRQELILSSMSEHGEKSDIGTSDCESQCPSEALSRQLRLGFKPWKTHREAKPYVRGLDKQMVMPTWGLLYCGGAKPVRDELKKISQCYGISLHIESFGW